MSPCYYIGLFLGPNLFSSITVRRLVCNKYRFIGDSIAPPNESHLQRVNCNAKMNVLIRIAIELCKNTLTYLRIEVAFEENVIAKNTTIGIIKLA